MTELVKKEIQEYISIPFTPALQKFHIKCKEINWVEKIPGCVFIRDFENLPTSATFDVDLLADENSWSNLLSIFKSTAEDCGLVLIYRTSKAGLFIFIFDISQDNARRNWAYYEVHKRLPFTFDSYITARDIKIDYATGLPLPSLEWQFLLLIHQGLRKGKLSKYCEKLSNMLENNPDVQTLCKQRLGITNNDIKSILKEFFEIYKKIKVKLIQQK